MCSSPEEAAGEKVVHVLYAFHKLIDRFILTLTKAMV